MPQVRVYGAYLHSSAAAATTDKRVRIYQATLNGEKNQRVRIYSALLSGPVPTGHVRIYQAQLHVGDVNTFPVYVSSAGGWAKCDVHLSNAGDLEKIT